MEHQQLVPCAGHWVLRQVEGRISKAAETKRRIARLEPKNCFKRTAIMTMARSTDFHIFLWGSTSGRPCEVGFWCPSVLAPGGTCPSKKQADWVDVFRIQALGSTKNRHQTYVCVSEDVICNNTCNKLASVSLWFSLQPISQGDTGTPTSTWLE